jgi:group II intron reverse transcriptase/maturase
MENTKQDNMPRTQSRKEERGTTPIAHGMSHGVQRVRKVAKQDKNTKFTALLHHVNVDSLRASYNALKHTASPGIDGQTWADYQENLQERLEKLHRCVHAGAYRALPSRRVYIPKSDGRKRPLGIAAIEDKIVQHAVGTVLTAIYEADFLGFSYGFRPRRGCHDALEALYMGVLTKKIGFVLDADIQGFFDSISHQWMLRFLEKRVADRRILRLVRKWLRAGVSEEGKWSRTDAGTPQGAVISPMLANIFLHYVLDDWVVWWRTTQAKGDVIIVRYADDFVMGFQYQNEAENFLAALKERLGSFGLKLHPEKTRLIEFGRYAAERRKLRGEGKPETFDFLGFTHICAVSRKNRKFKIIRKTVGKRMRATLARLKDALRVRKHDAVEEVGQWLHRVVQGYYRYFAVPDNMPALSTFRWRLQRIWLSILRRRSQKYRMNWSKFLALTKRWIPTPTPLHPHPGTSLASVFHKKSLVR